MYLKQVIKNNKDLNISLIEASINGSLPVVKYTVENGADPNEGLAFAASRGKIEIVKYLIENGANVNKPNSKGSIAIEKASSHGHISIVKYLKDKGADVNIIAGDSGHTPLTHASSHGLLEVVKYLIENGAYINIVNNYGYTPLVYAASNGHLDLLKYLNEKRSSNIIVSNDTELFAAFQKASSHGHIEVVKYFIEKGINSNKIEASNFNLGIQVYLNQYKIYNDQNPKSIVHVNKYGVYKGTPTHDNFIIYNEYEGKRDGYKLVIEDFNADNRIDYLDLRNISSVKHIYDVDFYETKFNGIESTELKTKETSIVILKGFNPEMLNTESFIMGVYHDELWQDSINFILLIILNY